MKANDVRFDHMGLVQNIMDGIEDELIIKLARHGEHAIETAEPIQPLLGER